MLAHELDFLFFNIFAAVFFPFYLLWYVLAVLNYFFGDFFPVRADGLVLRDQSVVATTYVARVDSIDVKEGQTVEKGAPLLRLQSLEILERLADLSTKRAELMAKATDFKIHTRHRRNCSPLAERGRFPKRRG